MNFWPEQWAYKSLAHRCRQFQVLLGLLQLTPSLHRQSLPLRSILLNFHPLHLYLLSRNRLHLESLWRQNLCRCVLLSGNQDFTAGQEYLQILDYHRILHHSYSALENFQLGFG